MRTAGGYGMLAGIGSVDLSDAEAITFTYLGRFTVRLPWDSDLDYIFRSVQDLVNGLESNETGEINYMLLKSKGEMPLYPVRRRARKKVFGKSRAAIDREKKALYNRLVLEYT